MSRKLVATALSGIFPGLGQFYNKQWMKGALFLIAGIVPSWLFGRALPADLDLDALAAAFSAPGALAALGVLLAVWVWSILDAWWRA